MMIVNERAKRNNTPLLSSFIIHLPFALITYNSFFFPVDSILSESDTDRSDRTVKNGGNEAVTRSPITAR